MQRNMDKVFTLLERATSIFETQQEQEKEYRKREKDLGERETLKRKLAKYIGFAEMYKKKIHKLEEDLEKNDSELKEKESDLEDMRALNNTLIMKDIHSNDELQEARGVLIEALKDQKVKNGQEPLIFVKMMGQLPSGPFISAVERKYGGGGDDDDEEEKLELKEQCSVIAAELCSLWEHHLQDSSWHPFIQVEGSDKSIINKDDEKLKQLEEEHGSEVYKAVETALTELNEYNASGRYSVAELWNRETDKRADLKDGLMHILKLLEYTAKMKGNKKG